MALMPTRPPMAAMGFMLGMVVLTTGMTTTRSAAAQLGVLATFAGSTGTDGFPCYADRAQNAACRTGNLCDQSLRCRDMWTTCLRSVWASEAAYSEHTTDAQRSAVLSHADLNLVASQPKGRSPVLDSQVLVAASDDLIVVAIGGTDSVRDGLWDLGTATIPLDPDLPCLRGDEPGCARIHTGFAAYSNDIMPFVLTNVRAELKKSRRPVHLVGHSLGGAVAQFVAYKLVRDERVAVDAVVTFGSPKLGNGEFRKLYDSVLKYATQRWVNDDDLVPNFPFRPEYERAGQQIYMDYAANEGAGFNTGVLYCTNPWCDPMLPPTLEVDSSDHEKGFTATSFDYHSLMLSYLVMIEGFVPCGHPLRSACR